MAHILLVEDDERVAAALLAALGARAYQVDRVATAAAAMEFEAVPDLVLLDLGLPDMDGFELWRRRWKDAEIPVIAVTARGTPQQVVHGLQQGADDYVVKPFSIAELTARIDAVLRRTGRSAVRREPRQIGDVVIDLQGHSVSVGGEVVQLARKEFDLLAFLVERQGEAVGRAELLQAVWHTSWEGKSRTVDVHVAAVRHKLGRPDLIQTVHGVGYRLPAP